MIPCWSGEVISVAFAIDCNDREVPAFVASPRPLTGADIRALMDRTLWARFGEATLKALHAAQWLSDNGPQYTATASVLLRQDCLDIPELGAVHVIEFERPDESLRQAVYAHELGLVPITTPAYSPRGSYARRALYGKLGPPITVVTLECSPF